MEHFKKDISQRNKVIVGFVGLIGSGKDTAADYLVNFRQFKRDSFASTLKDAVSVVFGWDREMLEGRTSHSRAWREQVDIWWANRLGIANLTPRWVLQYWGTDVLRESFHDDIWIASLENKMRKTLDNIVISDVRFPNELAAIKNAGGIVVRIKRGDNPKWFHAAEIYNNSSSSELDRIAAKQVLEEANVHASEYSWVGSEIDYEIYNDSTIDSLYRQIERLVATPLSKEVKIVLDLY